MQIIIENVLYYAHLLNLIEFKLTTVCPQLKILFYYQTFKNIMGMKLTNFKVNPGEQRENVIFSYNTYLCTFFYLIYKRGGSTQGPPMFVTVIHNYMNSFFINLTSSNKLLLHCFIIYRYYIEKYQI